MADHWWEGLTEKQRRFCEYYSSNGGNQTRAASEAGYANPEPRAAELVRNSKIIAALEKMRSSKTKKHIATREERQNFWTEVLLSGEVEMKDRLKASELLGKSQADFVDRKEISGANGGPLDININLESLTDEQLAALESIASIAAE